MYVPREIDQELEKERSKYFIKNANLMIKQQREAEEQKKLAELKGLTTIAVISTPVMRNKPNK